MDQTHTLQIDGMSCGGCVGRVERGLQAVDGLHEVTVNLATQTARLSVADPSALRRAAAALDDLGYPGRTEEIALTVQSLSCAGCVGRVEAALTAVPGVRDVSVNLATGRAVVTALAGVASGPLLAKAATDAGYPAEALSAETLQASGPDRESEARDLLGKLLPAAALTLVIFVLDMGAHLVPAIHSAIAATIGMQGAWVLQALMASVVLFGPGRGFFAKGLPALWQRRPDMNSLVAVGTGAAWTYSMVATLAPWVLPDTVRAVYFESAAVIVTLILLGRWLEARAKGRTGAAIQTLLGLQAPTAILIRDGTETEVAVDSLSVGDLVRLRPGARVPSDGDVVDGASYIDESMITGEPLPVAKEAGATVTGGTVNGTGALTLRVTRVGAETTLSQIIRMVEDAQGAKLPVQALVDRITLWFVPAVMALACVTVVLWLIFGPAPVATFALVAGVSVLIIACPCAMGLATPTSIMVGSGRAAELGVLFRRGAGLQNLSEVDVIAFDKTGTVTEGKPSLTEVALAHDADRTEVLGKIAAAESLSEHPIAAAILQGARAEGIALPGATSFQSVTGYGVTAQVDGQVVHVGAARFMSREGIDLSALTEATQPWAARGHTVIYAAFDGRAVAALSVSDPIKPSSAQALATLRAQGYRLAMITGDSAASAQAVAADVGIDHVVADVLPDGKVAALEALQTGNQRVAFVGDGINDAPALAHADVGIAIGTGTDIAIETADVILMSGDLQGVATATDISRRTLRNIRQNLVWAFGYNVALIPVAAGALYPLFGVMLSPGFAAGAMALSSVSVLTNALRLRRITPAQRRAAARGAGPLASTPQEVRP